MARGEVVKATGTIIKAGEPQQDRTENVAADEETAPSLIQGRDPSIYLACGPVQRRLKER